jgi:4-amino-4-deoxy-L-arabinose transferase-like glycosyltransferase
LAATVGLLYLIWRRVAGRARGQLFFFPLLLFALNQEVQLRYPNALLECGTTLILLVATYGYLRLRSRAAFSANLAIGLGAALAFLAKGPVGLFILVLPVCYTWFVGRRFSVTALLVPVATLLIAFGLLFLVEPAAWAFLREYVDHQVVSALTGRATENVAGSRFALLGSLLGANAIGIALSGLLLFVDGGSVSLTRHRIGYVFLLTGAAAVLPFLVSLKQADYYQLPALPYLFLGVSALLTDRLERVVAYLRMHRLAGGVVQVVSLSALVGCGLIALRMYGTTDPRDIEPIQQAESIARIMDSLHTDRYRLSVIDDPHSTSSPLSHTLTGTLNRRHRIYHDPADTTSLVLYLAFRGGALPPVEGQEVLLEEEGVSLRR